MSNDRASDEKRTSHFGNAKCTLSCMDFVANDGAVLLNVGRRLVLMIRRCDDGDVKLIWQIINDGAQAYKGIIPADRWTEPYMSMEKLRHEIDDGVVFWGFEDGGTLVGVMGLQKVQDVTLIRHAYVRTSNQKRGIGAELLSHLREMADGPVLIGTWADASWAIRFYERYGFEKVGPEEKVRLLKRYWTVPERQIETSVVLADSIWREAQL
jgi:N-acetylglutamate synthase-like GNAT family acetyltransferase